MLLPYCVKLFCPNLVLVGVGKIARLADRMLWPCIALDLVKHSDRYDGAVFFMDLWTITAVLKSISC